MRNFFTGKQVLSGLFATAFVATASFSMFAADNTNLMAGWDGNGIGTTTDVPSDFGWACSDPGLEWMQAIDETSNNYKNRYRDNLPVGRVVTHDESSAVFSYPLTLEAGKFYRFEASCLNMNHAVSTVFGISDKRDGTGVVYGSQTLTVPKWDNNGNALDFRFIFEIPSDGTYYMTWQTPVPQDRSLAGKFSVTEVAGVAKVTFDTDGAAEIPAQIFEKGMSYSIIRPADPQKDGYVFLGWYADADYNTLFDFNVPVTGNTTVYARFIDLSAENERIILDGGTTTLPSAINLDVTLKGTAQLILTGEVPMMNSKISMFGSDVCLYMPGCKPSIVRSEYLKNITIDGRPFDNAADRLSVYGHGSVIIPDGWGVPLTIYTEANYGGESRSCEQDVYYRGKLLGKKSYLKEEKLEGFNNNIRSFKLKKGYMCTLANNDNGSGYSRVFIADEADLLVPELPEGLEFASFIRVCRWDWVGKKGICNKGLADLTNSGWYNTWGGGDESWEDSEFVPMRHHHGWDSFSNINSRTNVSHLLGYNEPDHTDQSNISVYSGIVGWPEFFQSGLRLGSPAPDSINKDWLKKFMAMADSLNYRVDFVATHMYWNSQNGEGLTWNIENECKNSYGGRPMWITEWNNGANWTNESWPDAKGTKLDAEFNVVYDENGNTSEVKRPHTKANSDKQVAWLKDMLQAFDDCEYIERHSFYNWVEDARSIEIGGKLTPAGKVFAEFQSRPFFTRSREYPHVWKIAPPLPQVIRQGERNILTFYDHNWETGKFYTIQRRLNNGHWVEVATKEFGKDYKAGSTVTFIDLFNNTGKVDYRVKATSYKDTESLFSRIVSLDVVSGIEGVDEDGAELYIRGEGSDLVVDASADASYPIYTLDGRFVRNIEVVAGRNVISGLAAGFYIVNENKVIIM